MTIDLRKCGPRSSWVRSPVLAASVVAAAVCIGVTLPALAASRAADPVAGPVEADEPSSVWDSRTQAVAGHMRPEDERRALDEGYPTLPFRTGDRSFTGLEVVDGGGAVVGYMTIEVGYVSIEDSRDPDVLQQMLDDLALTPEEERIVAENQDELDAEIQRQMDDLAADLRRQEGDFPLSGG